MTNEIDFTGWISPSGMTYQIEPGRVEKLGMLIVLTAGWDKTEAFQKCSSLVDFLVKNKGYALISKEKNFSLLPEHITPEQALVLDSIGVSATSLPPRVDDGAEVVLDFSDNA